MTADSLPTPDPRIERLAAYLSDLAQRLLDAGVPLEDIAAGCVKPADWDRVCGPKPREVAR